MRKVLLISLILGLLYTPAVGALDLSPFDQHNGQQFFTITDDAGKIIAKIGSLVSVGDYLITEDDSGYRISSVQEFTAKARYDGKVDLEKPGWVMVSDQETTTTTSLPTQAPGAKPKIGVYYTHSEESYVPHSGTADKKRGDVYQVGGTLAQSLKTNGAEAVVSENNHSPRDANAYNRSRATAMQLLRQRPGILVDVHRDGIPDPNYYNKTINGEPVAQIRIVVGKQNANRSVNFDFAKELKARANELYPGLVKEIFWAKGNYNQDLAPRVILLEFGTHTNTLQRAEKSAQMMGKVLATMVGAAAPQQQGLGTAQQQQNQPTGRPGDQTGGWSSALWILAITVVGFIVYALVNSQGVGGIKYMLSKFTSKELRGFFGGTKKSTKREIKIPPEDDQREE